MGTAPAQTRAGRRERREQGTAWRWALFGVLVLVGASAVYGGVGLMADGLGMPPDWLDSTPFTSWVLPGVALLVTVALPQLGAAWLVVVHHPRAALGALVVGAALVLWIAVQLLVLRRYFILQPVIAGFGVVEMLFAWRWTAPGRRLR